MLARRPATQGEVRRGNTKEMIFYDETGPLARLASCLTLRNSLVHLDVEDFSQELLQCLLCHKEPARHIQSPLLGACSSLVLYGIRLRCTERSYYRRPYAIKNQRGARGFLRSKALSRGLWMRRAGSLWHKRHLRSNTMRLSIH